MSRLSEYTARIEALQGEFDDVSAPQRAECMMVCALAIIDGFCFSHTKRRANVDEFVTIARRCFSKMRELVPLVKPAPPGEN